MLDLESAIAIVRRVHSEIGTAELARISGVPYTTLRDWEARDFTSPAFETLTRLAAAAEAHEARPAGDVAA